MSQLLVRDLDPTVVERLKERAKRHRRSLQGEAKAILEAAVLPVDGARKLAAQWHRHLAGAIAGDSAELIREDRDR